MSKVVTATEAKNLFGALMEEAQAGPVIVESRGVQKVAIVSIEDLRELEKLRDADARRRDIETLRNMVARLDERNADLSAEEAAEIADRVRHDVAEAMIERGKIRFEE